MNLNIKTIIEKLDNLLFDIAEILL